MTSSKKLLVVILPAMVKSHFRVCIVLIVARSHSRLYYFFLYISLIMRYVTSAVVTNQLPRSRKSLEHLKMTTIY